MLYWFEEKALDKMFIVVKKGLVNNWYKEVQKHSFIIPAIFQINLQTILTYSCHG